MGSHRSIQTVAFLAAVLLALCGRGALAHGGGLHRWGFNRNILRAIPTANIYTDAHTTVASCNSFSALNLAALTPGSFTLPWSPPQLNMTVNGAIDVLSYLSGNCTTGANGGIFPFLQFHDWIKQGNQWVSRPPPSGMTASAYGFTGTCAAPGNLYRNNVTLQDNRFNLAWWANTEDAVIGTGMNSTDLYPGYVWGASVNSWFFRNATNPDRLKSIIVFAQAGPAFCCNVNYTGYPAPDAVLAQGKNCSQLPPDRRRAHRRLRHHLLV